MTDSRIDTYQHIDAVRKNLLAVIAMLNQRLMDHDQSKLSDPEKSAFDEFTPKLSASTYNSEEYKSFLAAMKPALDHHYKHNRHHPEFHAAGITDMNLVDLIEMFCDWLAATKRHKDGCIKRSIDQNQKRFGYSDELKAILRNTAMLFHDFVEVWHCFGCGAGGCNGNFCYQCGAGRRDYS